VNHEGMDWGAVAATADKNDCDRTRRPSRKQLSEDLMDDEYESSTPHPMERVGFIAWVPKSKVGRRRAAAARPPFDLGPWDGARVGSHTVALSSAQANFYFTRLNASSVETMPKNYRGGPLTPRALSGSGIGKPLPQPPHPKIIGDKAPVVLRPECLNRPSDALE
jgi:hypothetical protein